MVSFEDGVVGVQHFQHDGNALPHALGYRAIAFELAQHAVQVFQLCVVVRLEMCGAKLSKRLFTISG